MAKGFETMRSSAAYPEGKLVEPTSTMLLLVLIMFTSAGMYFLISTL